MMRGGFGLRIIYMIVFLLIFGVVRGAIGYDNAAGVFVAPIVAGFATIAISYWVRGVIQRRNGG